MTTTHTVIRNRSRVAMRLLLVLLVGLALLSVNLHSRKAAAQSSQTQTIVLQTEGAPLLQGTFQTVTNDTDLQGAARVSCNLVSYSNGGPQGASTIRYHDLLTGADNVIPGNEADLVSDVSGSNVAYWKVDGGEEHIRVFDTTSQTFTQIPGAQQSYPSIGGNLVAFEDRTSSFSWLMADISVYDLSTGTFTRLTNDSLSNVRPSVSHNGDAVVWEKCTNLGQDCVVYSAIQTAPGVFTTRALTEPFGARYFPSTNGEIAVYISQRSGDADVYYQPLAGGTEVHLAIPGPQHLARISGDFITFESQSLIDFDVDIYVYNIRTGKLFQVTDTPIHESMGEIGVCNGVGRIVYAAESNPSYDIFAFSFQALSAPEDQIDDLITTIGSFNLPQGTANSLITKLQQALTAIDAGDIATACSSLAAFTSECAAQSGKKLTADQSTQLTNLANQIKSDLGCP